ncbi:hypothetical protein [Vibrio fluvialis]|uniref:hypothetical protein n=1 Tax=Vibrio fluvialis TaxID=676 RepID=UPI0037DA948D
MTELELANAKILELSDQLDRDSLEELANFVDGGSNLAKTLEVAIEIRKQADIRAWHKDEDHG